MASPKVHPFYHIWFKWVDPISLIPTVYGLLFTPDFMLEGLIPASMSVPDPDQAFMFHQLAALYAFVAITIGLVLRATLDLKVWRIVMAAVLMIDIAMLASTYVSLEHQGRLALEALRWQDWGNIGYTGGVALIRAAFLAGVGVGGGGKGKKA